MPGNHRYSILITLIPPIRQVHIFGHDPDRLVRVCYEHQRVGPVVQPCEPLERRSSGRHVVMQRLGRRDRAELAMAWTSDKKRLIVPGVSAEDDIWRVGNGGGDMRKR